MLTAFVMIETDADMVSTVAQAVANSPNVAEVYSVTGDFNVIAIVRVADHEMLAEAVPDQISRIDGVRRTHTMLAFRSFSAKDLAWDVGTG
ncbi:MAG: Lrp/AsnC ligand binding domain-containing protein [Thermoflexales bacterium]